MSRVIVKFRDADARSVSELDERCEAVRTTLPEAELIRRSARSGRAVFSVEAVEQLDKLIEDISAWDDVEYAERDEIDSAQ